MPDDCLGHFPTWQIVYHYSVVSNRSGGGNKHAGSANLKK